MAIDVDWSSNYGLFGYTNSHNDGYWAESRAQFYAENFTFVPPHSIQSFFKTSTNAFKGGISMWGGVSVHGLYPADGPIFRDELLKSSKFKVIHVGV